MKQDLIVRTTGRGHGGAMRDNRLKVMILASTQAMPSRRLMTRMSFLFTYLAWPLVWLDTLIKRAHAVRRYWLRHISFPWHSRLCTLFAYAARSEVIVGKLCRIRLWG